MGTQEDLLKFQQMYEQALRTQAQSTATPDLGQYVVGPAYNWQTYTGPWQQGIWEVEVAVAVDREESQVQNVIKKFKERIYESDMERKW